MKISEVSNQLNIPSATLRYYEKIGLLENVAKQHGIRDYQEKDIETLQFILCMKKSGFPLEAIINFLKLDGTKKSGQAKRLEMLLQQKDEILKEIAEKKETLKFLNHKIDFYETKTKQKEKN